MKQYTKKASVRNRYKAVKNRLESRLAEQPVAPKVFHEASEEVLSHNEHRAPVREDDSQPDDALSLYLHQMGSISLLSREQELELARRLEAGRTRYRHAVLSNWQVLARLVEQFEQVRGGQPPLERV